MCVCVLAFSFGSSVSVCIQVWKENGREPPKRCTCALPGHVLNLFTPVHIIEGLQRPEARYGSPLANLSEKHCAREAA